MSDNLIYKIALTQIPGIGSVLAKNLISYCGGVEYVFKQKKSTLLKIPGIGPKLANEISLFKDLSAAEREIDEISKRNIKTAFFLDSVYPFRLKQIQDCPILLYSSGDAQLSPTRCIAMVGTRKITPYGKRFISDFIEQLQGQQVTVVSGMAYGVDVWVHKECLKYGIPTIGVLAHGLDRIYPSLHLRVAQAMLKENGALVTEYPTCTNPDRENFPKRNRVIAGMVDAVIVVESALRGGSLITAELANQYNREVMAVPGDLYSEYSKGCSFLIKKNKAHLLEGVQDLVQLMNWDIEFKPGIQKTLFADLKPEEHEVMELIRSFGEIGIDQLLANVQMSLGALASTLLELELKNCISSLPGKRYCIG